MFSLIAVGTGTAYLYSLLAALFPQAFPSSFRLQDGFPAVYFEASAAIISLVKHFPNTAEHYKNLLSRFKKLSHVTVEVNVCGDKPCTVPDKDKV